MASYVLDDALARSALESWKDLRLTGRVAAAAARRLSKSENTPGILCKGGGWVEVGVGGLWFVNNQDEVFLKFVQTNKLKS